MKKSLKHGYAVKTKRIYLYNAWVNIKQKCYNDNLRDKNKANIGVYKAWLNNFQEFYDWAVQNGYKDGMQLERIDKNKDFCPDNCRWAENKKNDYTNITFDGKTQSLLKWSKELNMSYYALLKRLDSGWSVSDALSKPIRKKRGNPENK